MIRNCEVDIGRCACIHSQFQAIDAVLQCVLYQRGLVPAPVPQILSHPETSHEVKFAGNFAKIREALREVFRSHNRSSVREVLILIGSSRLLPKELYVVNVDLCGTSNLDECHENCAELSSKELRKVSSTMLFNLFSDGFALSGTQASQVYILVRASSTLRFPAELVEEDDGFVFPSDCVISRKKIALSYIVLKHHCQEWADERKEDKRDDLTWFRLSPCLRKFSA